MKFKKDKLAFGIFQDGLSIKVAQLGVINDKIRIIRLEETALSHPLGGEEISEEIEKLEELEELKIPEISEYDKPEEIEKVEEAPEDLTGKTDLQNLLANFPLDKGKIALNANEEQISYYQFEPGFFTSGIKKKIQTEILSKEELKAKNYTFDYIYNDDKSILAFVHRGQFELLKALQEINLIVSKKKLFYSFIDTNEISLMNLVRVNYDFPPEDYVLILYIGVDYKVGIVMKGKGHYKTFPIIVTETEPEKMRQAIYSKIMLEQDVSNIPITQHIILVGEQVNNEDVESFQEKCNEGATVNRLELNKVGIVKERKDEITPEKIAQYAIPIALAWKTLDTKNKAFFPSNLLPTKIIERQKHFKIAWHGFFVLGAIFYFTFMGTTKNMTLKQQILNAQQINRELELEIRQKQNIITKISQIRSEISVLEDNILKIENLIGSKNQWHYILNVIANAFLENEISWINNLKSSEDNFQISGYTTQKRNIIRFSKLFLNGRIERITKHLMQDLTIWRYDMTFPYPDPKDIEKEKEEGLSKIQIAELTEEPPEPEPEPITKEPIKPETFEIEVSEVNIKEIYNNIVSIYFKRNTQDAYERFKEFIIKYPDHKLAHNANYLMGECLYTLGKISEAKVIFENTIKQKGTKTPDALMMLGNSYFKENDINNAIYYWNQLVTNYPDHKLAIIAKNKINTFSSLENIYKEKSESKPRATIVEKEVVKKEVYELQLLSRRDYSQVEQDKKEIEQFGYKTKITSLLKDGEIFYRLRLDDSYTQSKAIALGEKIKELFPFINNYWIEKILYDDDISKIYHYIINIYFSGEFDKALEKLSEFSEKYPSHPLAYNTNYLTGECLYQIGRITEAKKIFENTIKLKGNKTPDALMMIGNCYKKENDLNRAIDYWNQLINTFPDNKLSKIAQYKIKIFKD